MKYSSVFASCISATTSARTSARMAASALAISLAILLATALTACAGMSGNPGYPLDFLGAAAAPQAAQRTIVITEQTRWVNVEGGEIVRFVAGKRQFTWNFDGPADVFDLKRIAPPGTLDHTVTAYVAPNPLYLREGGHF
jgi:hypothetical protein